MLLVPTRRRLAKLRNFCDSAKKAKTSTPALLIVDKADYAENAEEYQAIEASAPAKWKIAVTEAEGMGPKIREVWAAVEDCAWVAVLNDDHYIVTSEWDVRLLKQLNGHNFVTCGDRWNAPVRAAGATVFSMDLVKAWGFPLFPPEIDHLGIDDVWEMIGRNTGCWKIDMSVIIEHHHAYKNQDLVDETHKKIYGENQAWLGSPQHKDVVERVQKFIKETLPGAVERTKRLQLEERNPAWRETKIIPVSDRGSDMAGESESGTVSR